MANEWPLTGSEREELQKRLLQNISMEQIVGKYSNHIQSIFSEKFTHCCTCPNKNHKQGSEKTPSFYFSENDKHFYCFGCKKNGNAFDFLSMMTGISAEILTDDYVKEQGVSIHDLPEPPVRFPILNLSFELSVKLRKYLCDLKNTEFYNAERAWVDGIYLRMDERFNRLTDTDFEEARMFYMQVLMELERRL